MIKEFKKRYLGLLKIAYKKNELNFPDIIARYESLEAFDLLIQFIFKTKWITYATKHPFAGQNGKG